MVHWNKAHWLAVESHMTSFNQSDFIIPALCSYDSLKFVYDINSIRGVMINTTALREKSQEQPGMKPVWPDLAKFRPFGKILRVFGRFW